MRRPMWYRVLMALWGLWFTTALTEPAGFLACPMHSGVGGHGSMAAATSSAPVEAAPVEAAPHAHHAGMDMSSHEVSSHDDSTPTSPTHPCCTCLGQCCTMSPADVPQSLVLPTSPLPLQTAAAPIGYTSRVVTRIAYATPFANGPPARIA